VAKALSGVVVRGEPLSQLVDFLDTLPLECATYPLSHVLLAIREQVEPAREREVAQAPSRMLE
jgi:hypothetical protein